jgi:hypothetical protein
MATIGTCSLCLDAGPLSFEHVPPRRVFNNNPTVAHTIYGLERGSQYKKMPLLLPAPRGLGCYAFCERCNGQTGAWYGEAFAVWTAQCLRYASKITSVSAVEVPFHIQPLNVLKQIATMAIAVSGSRKSNPTSDALRRFILSRQSMSLPPNIFFKTYFNPVDPARTGQPQLTQNRLSGSCAVLDIRSGNSVFIVAEIAFPPMGYVVYSMSPGEKASEDFESLCDIRRFFNNYYSQTASIFMRIPVRRPFGPVPGYYPNLRSGVGQKFLDDDHVVLTGKEV